MYLLMLDFEISNLFVMLICIKLESHDIIPEPMRVYHNLFLLKHKIFLETFLCYPTKEKVISETWDKKKQTSNMIK